jgi:RNA polymerase sigma-70 factor, ECF subfamily
MSQLPAVERTVASDQTLVESALAGDRAAFGELVRRYERMARAVCVVKLCDYHLALDAAQEAFVAAYQRLAQLRDHAAFGPWLLTICRNEAMRLVNKRPGESSLPADRAAAKQPDRGDAELLEAVLALPEQERVVVMMRFFDRRDVTEIAAMLGRPVGTITKQLSRAYENLRQILEERP